MPLASALLPAASAAGVLAHGVSGVLAHGAANHDELPPLTGQHLVTVWQFDVVVVIGLLVAAVLYLTGVARLRARGAAWSPWRTAAFVLGGLGSIAIATMSSLGAYDDTLFSVHMVQHMVLTMVSPVFLALGAPVTLALRTLPLGGRRRLTAVLHSRVVRVLASPLVAGPIFVGTLYVLYFTPLYQLTLEHAWLHELTHVHFLVSGCLFFWPLLGLDPMPNRLPHPARLLVLFLMLPAHAWLGIAVMSSNTVIAGDFYREHLRTWGPSLLADQQIGGAILWGTGDLFSLALFVTIFVQWVRADEREARRTDRRMDRESREVGEAAELAAYNARLAELARRTGASG